MIFLFCYVVSLGISYLAAMTEGTGPGVGSSVIIFSILPFTCLYYLNFFDKIRFRGMVKLVPIGIGFVGFPLVMPLITGIQEKGYVMIAVSSFYHFSGAFLGLVVASVLFRREL